MRDLRKDLNNVWRASARLTSPSGSRAVMFIAARSGEGTTSMAASFALLASKRSRRTAWLVDLDLRRNGVFKGFQSGFARRVGKPGRAYDAGLATDQIYAVSPQTATQGGQPAGPEKLLTAHQIEGERLMITRFRNDRLRPGQRVRVRSQPRWWRALRKAADWIIVDSPALERSGAGLAVASQMDGVVIVVRADHTSAEDLVALKREIEAHGGTIIGVVVNAIRADARLIDRMSL